MSVVNVQPGPQYRVEVRTKGVQGTAGIVQEVVAGTNVTVDNTDPHRPVVSATGGGGGGGVSSVVAGMGIEVNSANPAAPVVGVNSQTQASLSLAESALQPGDIAPVATSGNYSDLSGKPTLGTAAAQDAAAFATAAQGAKADTAIQTIVAGGNITVDNTDPQNPIVSSSGGGGGGGSVTSVAMTVPTGLSVAGSPVTTSGTLALSHASGYQAYTSAEASKLAGIEAGADVTDATNVSAAGAFMTASDDLDDISEGATNKHFTSTEKTKLSGIASGATANSADATLLDRANHTGTQLAATISDFSTAADARVSAAIGVTVQAYSAKLAAFAGLTGAADKLAYFTGASSMSTADLTSVARTLLAQTTQSNMRSTGLGLTSDGSSLVTAANYAAMRTLLSLGGAALLNVGTTNGTVAAGDDSRVTGALQAGTEDQTISGGARVTVKDLGSKSSGTVTPDPGDRPHQKYTNTGAHTLAPGSNYGDYYLDIINGSGAGAITTTGWTKVSGDSFTTTNGHKFRCGCSVTADGSTLVVLALQ